MLISRQSSAQSTFTLIYLGYLFKGNCGNKAHLFQDKRGSNAHSGSGSLTLLNHIASHFLGEYGEQLNRPPLKILSLGGRRVKFSPGKLKPRPDVVERILRFPYADPLLAEKKEQRAHVSQSDSIR
jgi:hypothetical protein